ncbi:MAG: 3-deoxy-D-manno-octulosonic acid transferase, partial [Bacteroidetes bacterium]
MKIYYLVYNYITFPLLYLVAHLFYPFNSKIRKGLKERKKLFENLIISLAGIDKSKKVLWFHSSSMGEFEQAKPIIENIKKSSDHTIVVTFFSPSGYDNSLRYPYADVISYIPLDTPQRIKRFLNLVRPSIAV